MRLSIPLCLLLSFAQAAAQGTSARIVGAVADAGGQALPNVTVKVTSMETNAVRVATTDGEKLFRPQPVDRKL